MKNFINNLKELKKIEPNVDWTIKTRNLLMSDPALADSRKITLAEHLHIFILRLERRIIPSPVKVMATLLVFLLATGTTLAAKAAIPGNPLYPIKTQIEKVELVLVTTSHAEAVVHLKHAKNRIYEVEQLAKKDYLTKEIEINKVVKNLKKDITAAQNSLEVADKEDDNVGAVVAAAVQINEGAIQASQALNQAASQVNSEETLQTVNEVVEVTENVQNNTTGLIVDKKVSGQVDDDIVTTEQVKQIVVNNINTIEDKIKTVEEKVSQIEPITIAEAINQVSDTKLDALREQDVTDVINKKEEAKQVLEEARKLVNETSLSEAVAKTQESKELTMETEKVLNKIDQVYKDQQTMVDTGQKNIIKPYQNNSTTTASTTGLILEQIIEFGGINNEPETGLPEDSTDDEAIIEKTPTIIN